MKMPAKSNETYEEVKIINFNGQEIEEIQPDGQIKWSSPQPIACTIEDITKIEKKEEIRMQPKSVANEKEEYFIYLGGVDGNPDAESNKVSIEGNNNNITKLIKAKNMLEFVLLIASVICVLVRVYNQFSRVPATILTINKNVFVFIIAGLGIPLLFSLVLTTTAKIEDKYKCINFETLCDFEYYGDKYKISKDTYFELSSVVENIRYEKEKAKEQEWVKAKNRYIDCFMLDLVLMLIIPVFAKLSIGLTLIMAVVNTVFYVLQCLAYIKTVEN